MDAEIAHFHVLHHHLWSVDEIKYVVPRKEPPTSFSNVRVVMLFISVLVSLLVSISDYRMSVAPA